MQKRKINIGLDIGTTSVGWSILEDQTNNIIDLGVRLFSDLIAPKTGVLNNVSRREHRAARRRINRLKIRKQDFYKLLQKYKPEGSEIYLSKDQKTAFKLNICNFGVQNPLELRLKAINEKIPPEALIYLLFYYLHNRGYFYKNDDEDIKGTKELKEITKSYNSELLPCQNLENFYKETQYYKGLSNFSNSSIKKEINQILTHNPINEEFRVKYFDLLERVRKFEEGPGSEKSPTKYGLYQKDKNGNVIKSHENLWEKLIGKCTYYPEEYRGGKNSPIAELFNLLNDLSNIKLNGNCLSKTQKEIILDYCVKQLIANKKINLTPSTLIKVLKIDDSNLVISGYRIDYSKKDKKEIITELTSCSALIKFWKFINNESINTVTNIFDLISLLQILNNIFNSISKFAVNDSKINFLENEYSSVPKEEIESLVKILKTSETHSLSYKAMNEYIDNWINDLESNLNSTSYFQDLKQIRPIKFIKPTRYLNEHILDEEVISPTAKKSFRQTLKVLNCILERTKKEEWEINNIVIEVPRDRNSKLEKDKIKKTNEENKKIKEEFEKKLADNGINSPYNSKHIQKYKCWVQQDECDIYTGKKINLNDLFGCEYDLDHIIPQSICGDDSLENKVLTSYIINRHEKKDTTPYSFLNKNKDQWNNFLTRVKSLYGCKLISKTKYEYLTETRNPNELLLDFIGRNLVDTRYASKLILNNLQSFLKDNKYYPNVKVKVVRGKFTSFARNSVLKNLPKDRNVYVHHAIDASIVAWLGSNNKIYNLITFYNFKKEELINGIKEELYVLDENGQYVNKNTGEVLDFNIRRGRYINEFAKQLAKYNAYCLKPNDACEDMIKGELYDNVKFSRMIEKNSNIQLSDEQYISIKFEKDSTEGYEIKTINLLDAKEDLEKYFNENSNKDKSNLLIDINGNIYKNLLAIYNSEKYNASNSNPFVEYMAQEFPDIKFPKFIKIPIDNNHEKFIRVKQLRYKNLQRNLINLLPKIDKGNIHYLSSLKPLFVRIYKDNKGKYISFPINAKVLKSDKNHELSIDENKLKEMLIQRNVRPCNCNSESYCNDENCINKNYINIYYGTIFISKDKKEILYSIAGGTFLKNQLEFKNLKNSNSKRIFISVPNLIMQYDICQVDPLGKIYNLKKIEL